MRSALLSTGLALVVLVAFACGDGEQPAAIAGATYGGELSGGGGILLTVSEDGMKLATFKVTIPGEVFGEDCPITSAEFGRGVDEPITDDMFQWESRSVIDAPMSVAGRFTSGGTAEGTFDFSPADSACERAELTWTAVSGGSTPEAPGQARIMNVSDQALTVEMSGAEDLTLELDPCGDCEKSSYREGAASAPCPQDAAPFEDLRLMDGLYTITGTFADGRSAEKVMLIVREGVVVTEWNLACFNRVIDARNDYVEVITADR